MYTRSNPFCNKRVRRLGERVIDLSRGALIPQDHPCGDGHFYVRSRSHLHPCVHNPHSIGMRMFLKSALKGKLALGFVFSKCCRDQSYLESSQRVMDHISRRKTSTLSLLQVLLLPRTWL